MKKNPYEAEQLRLLDHLTSADPESKEYAAVVARLDEIDTLLNRRRFNWIQTAIPAATSVVAIAGIYALQQFGGVLIPKVLESFASRQK